MLLSLAIILLSGLLAGYVFKMLKLPELLGMILVGIVIGPFVLNVLDEKILLISSDLRQLAVIIILLQAGLTVDIQDLKRVGRPAILLCFLPACFEIIGMVLLGPKFLSITTLEATIVGCVIAAVSPAVVVPRMLKLMEEGYGNKHSIPTMILAGASVDDVFVIVVFSAFVAMEKSGILSLRSFLDIPLSIVFGILIGSIVGLVLFECIKKIQQDTLKIVIIVSISFLLVSAEKQSVVAFSGLLSIMALGNSIHRKDSDLAKKLSKQFSSLWSVFSILLFVLVGASVNIVYAKKTGMIAVVLVLLVLLFRMVGVFVSLFNTSLTKKEKLFTMLAYTPKATVQAAIGGIPLAMGLACGDVVLSVAVISILVSAPLGAILIDTTYKKLLDQ